MMVEDPFEEADENPHGSEDTAQVHYTESKSTNPSVATVRMTRDSSAGQSQHGHQGSVIDIDFSSLPQPEHLQLYEVIGRGGMSVVHRAWHRHLERSVAVKRLRPEFVDNQRMAQSFMAEAKIIAFLQHPGIPTIHELVKDQRGLPQLVMPLFEGSLWSDKQKKQTRKECITIVERIAEVIAYAHAHGIIHRDLKPSNVILGNYGEVLLIDWGLALHLSDKENLERQKKKIYGTPQYLDPEVARGNLIGTSVDIYGLGAILFESITGKPPHPFEKTKQAIEHAKNGFIGGHGDPEKDEVLGVALIALSSDPADRFQTVQEFLEALRLAVGHEEALRLVTLAEDAELLARSNDACYDLYQIAVYRYQEVIDMWPDNNTVRDKLHNCLAGYAEAAAQRGDYDLALSLYDDDCSCHHELISSVRKEKEIREAKDKELVRQQEFAAESAKVTKRINDVLVGVIQEARPERQGRGVSLIDAVNAAHDVINEEFADEVEIRIDLRMALLDVFNQSNLTEQYNSLREDIHKDMMEAGFGPRDLVFRKFTRYLILDHINAVRPRKALALGKEYVQWVSTYDSDNLQAITDARFLYGECLVECGKADLATQEFKSALAYFEQHDMTDSPEKMHFKGEIFAALKRGGKVDEAEEMLSDLDAGYRRYFPKPHPTYANFIANVVFLFMDQGEWIKAAHWAERLVNKRKVLYGKDAKTTLLAQSMLLAFNAAADRKGTLEGLVENFRVIQSDTNFTMPEYIEPLLRLAGQFLRRGNLEAAYGYLEQAISISETSDEINPEHWLYPLIGMMEARLTAAGGEYESALFMGLKSLKHIELLFGEGDGRARRLRVHLAHIAQDWIDDDPEPAEEWIAGCNEVDSACFKRSFSDLQAYPGLAQI